MNDAPSRMAKFAVVQENGENLLKRLTLCAEKAQAVVGRLIGHESQAERPLDREAKVPVERPRLDEFEHMQELSLVQVNAIEHHLHRLMQELPELGPDTRPETGRALSVSR